MFELFFFFSMFFFVNVFIDMHAVHFIFSKVLRRFIIFNYPYYKIGNNRLLWVFVCVCLWIHNHFPTAMINFFQLNISKILMPNNFDFVIFRIALHLISKSTRLDNTFKDKYFRSNVCGKIYLCKCPYRKHNTRKHLVPWFKWKICLKRFF